MAAPVTFGATIESPSAMSPSHHHEQHIQLQQQQPALRSPPSNESNSSANTTDLAEKEIAIDPSNPYSAFYKHPDARRSMDGASSAPQSKTHLEVNAYERSASVEAGVPLSAATTQQPKSSVDGLGRVKECTMWPSRQAMLEKKKDYKRARGCNLFRNLNSKQRLYAKIFIALFIVAAAVGLGVGISRAVGGGVWSGNGQSKTIPQR
ncbi:hypothetical protein BS50DRAFT_207230 [Corynespora cassiicola Philippines]|uniref:Uncharacterized protein n=1 Tax=Corynespora cassiicola Philippines TaxID=1448308 RepID=A0A2T2N5P8_CORCC|nr:hypothetical protein BS50DRAFT_207230 [Corynespora cassiicola Philippines]